MTMNLLGMLWRDRFATLAVLFLLVVLVCVLIGPQWLANEARAMNLMSRNTMPFSLEKGWLYVLGADNLGRSVLARIIVASRNTILISGAAVLFALAVGSVLGLIAGYRGGWISVLILRLADAIMSFPSLLLAVIVLFVFDAGVFNVVIVLAISRIPIFVRTVRAEVLEIKERQFVSAARAMGAGLPRILFFHIAPMIAPTLLTLGALEMAFIMLVESSLSFLGIGIQPPDVSWGLMVSDGRNYVSSAWWVSFWPGLAIMAVTMSLNVLANWIRMTADPMQRWRLGAGA
jgi:peptide/nickel transport system permease protein